MTLASINKFVTRVQTINQRISSLLSQNLEPNTYTGLDYLSIFTKDESEYEELCSLASSIGEKIYEKNGTVYQINNAAISPSIIRICNPIQTSLIGCADLIVSEYETIRKQLIKAGWQEKTKTLDGIDYRIIEVTDTHLGVSLYVPSHQMTKIMK